MTREKFEITKEDEQFMDSIGKSLKRGPVKRKMTKSPAHSALTKTIGKSHYSGKTYKHE